MAVPIAINVDGSGLKRLTTSSGEYPTWSPDGTRIAFSSARAGNYDIYVMNADGSAQTQLTNDPAYEMSPVWSPDGTQIAFDTQKDLWPPKEIGIGPEFEIHMINADGTGDTRLTNNIDEDRFPTRALNPRIVFARNGNLFIMNADGSDQTLLFKSASFPVWRLAILPKLVNSYLVSIIPGLIDLHLAPVFRRSSVSPIWSIRS